MGPSLRILRASFGHLIVPNAKDFGVQTDIGGGRLQSDEDSRARYQELLAEYKKAESAGALSASKFQNKFRELGVSVMMGGGNVQFTSEQKDQFRRRKEEVESLRPTNRAPPVIPGKIMKMLVWDFWEFGRPSGAGVLSKR